MSKMPSIAVVAPSDPRIDEASRARASCIAGLVGKRIQETVHLPNGAAVQTVRPTTLLDGEASADQIARMLHAEGADAVIFTCDSWAFPQPTALSLLAQLPDKLPVLIVTGNSAAKPGVVYAQALNGALAQQGRLSNLVVGRWGESNGIMTISDETLKSITDWSYAAMTYAGLLGRRVVLVGHDSMGMETALAHVGATRSTFGLEVVRLDMKLVADMLQKRAYDEAEVAGLNEWVEGHLGERLELPTASARAKFVEELGLYLILRGLLREYDAVGGGFQAQLEWGSDRRGIPQPVPDWPESLLNASFDHNGKKPPLPFATEADMQGLLTMLAMHWLSGGSPPLFMDLRISYSNDELASLAERLGEVAPQGFFHGNNSGSASLDWASYPGSSVEEVMGRVSAPLADEAYFPGGGNSVTFVTPGGIRCLIGRLAFHEPSQRFSMVWDEAQTTELSPKLEEAVRNAANAGWPHTFMVPRNALMGELKHWAPANHIHSAWGLPSERLQYWTDMTGVHSLTPWSRMPIGVGRPKPLVHLLSGE